MRQINTKFFFILTGSALALTGGVFALHRLQAGNITHALLWQASQAEKGGKLDQAARYLGRYLEFVPDDLEERTRLAMLLTDPKLTTTGRGIARARFVIEQVLAKDPQRHALREQLIRLALLSRQLDFAKEQFELLGKDYRSGEHALLKGEWYELQPRSRTPNPKSTDVVSKAIAAYKDAIGLSPGKPEAYLRLAALYRQEDFGKAPAERKYADAMQQLVAAALLKIPNDPGILSLAAQVTQERGDAAKARAYLQDGLKLSPAEPRLYLALARVDGADGKRAEALQALRRGVQEVGKEGKYELTWALANLLLDDNQLDQAQQHITEIREISARSAEYLDARVQMLQGRWFEAARTFEKLRPHLQTIRELTFQLDLYLGACYEQLEEPALQLASYRRAAATDPSSLAARRGLATALWSMGQLTEALEKYQETILANTDRKEAARWRLEYARLLLLSHPSDLQPVKQEVDEAEKELPSSIDAALVRAELAIKQGKRRDDARSVLNATWKKDNQRYEPWVFLAALSLADGQADDARRLLREAEKIVDDSVEFRLARIRFWAQQHGAESEAALKQMEQGLDKFTPPQRARLLQALAEAHRAAERMTESVRLVRLVTQLPQHAKDLRVRLQLVELAMMQKDDEGARAVLAEMKKLEEDGASIYSSYGEAGRLIWHARNGRRDGLEEARKLLVMAGAQRPNWHAVTLARAEIDEMQGKTEQAIANYRLALEQGSRDPRVMKQLVLLLSETQRWEEAETVVQQMQKQFDAGDALQRLSIALAYNAKDLPRAEVLLRQAMQGKSQHFRDYLWLGQLLLARRHASPDAEAAFRRAVELGANQPEAWVGLVRYLAATGQADKARHELKRAEAKLSPATRALALAQCYDVLSDSEQTLKYYQIALEEQPGTAAVLRAAADFYLRTGRLGAAEPVFRKLTERELAGSEQDAMRARRGLAVVMAQTGRSAKVVEALRLVGLSLDEQGRLAQTKFAEQADEQLAQARVLAALPSHHLRARAIPLLEGQHQKRLLQIEDQYLLARLLHMHSSDLPTWQKTRELLKEITDSAPKTSRYLAFAAQLLVQNKEVPAAETLVERLEKLEKERSLPAGTLGAVELRARCLELRGQGAPAIALLQEFAAQKNAPPARLLLLAALYGRLGQYKEALDVCQQVADQEGMVDEALGSAVAILRAGKPAETERNRLTAWQEQANRLEARFRAALLKNDAGATPTRLLLADMMELQGRFDEVEKLCRRVLKDESGNLVALNNLAWLLAQQAGKAEEALTLITQAIEKYGPRPELLDTRAVVYLNLGKYEQSVEDLQKVVSEAPTPARYFHLSRAQHQAKKQPEALAALRRADELGLTPLQLHPSEREVYRQVVSELRN
jgi:tetratricopeptide (TPR) repeat protein